MSIGNIRFDETMFRTRLEANIPVSNTSGAKLMIANSIAHPTRNGLPEIGLKFKSSGNEFEVVGHKLNRPKYPIIAKRLPDGRQFKFSLEYVNTVLAV